MWRSKASRSIASAAVLLLAVSGSAAVAASPVDQARKAKPADLVVKGVNGSITGATAQVSAKVTNKAPKTNGKKSKKNAVSFALSTDTVADAGDTALGRLPVPKLKPKKSASVSGGFAVPTTVPAGTYYVVACADPAGVVKEKKEKNNCAASAATVTVVAVPPAGPAITVSYSTTPGGGTVTGSATNGSCAENPGKTEGVCTVSSGVGTVVLTATSAGPPFNGWVSSGGGTCDGVTSGPGGSTMTFSAPTGNKSCSAIFGA